jgi:hypothetical protein
MIFTVSTRNYIGNHQTIVTHDEQGNEIPVMHILPGVTDFPGDISKMASNLTSLLNGHEPLHKINVGRNRMFWKRTDTGCELRVLPEEHHD